MYDSIRWINRIEGGDRAYKVKEAQTYPLYCPNCGQRRLMQDAKPHPAITIVTEKGELVEEQAVAVETITCCTRCEFRWSKLTDSSDERSSALYARIVGMDDSEMWDLMQFFNPKFKRLITDVAEKTEVSVGFVQRVLEGEKGSKKIVEALVAEFRARIGGKTINGKLVFEGRTQSKRDGMLPAPD